MRPVLAVQQVPHESLGAIGPALARAGLEIRLVDLSREPPPAFDPADYSGLVVLGGPMNVDETERYPFFADEVRWIQDALRAELPTLGVCLGSQLLAKAGGARVYSNGVKEIGWYDVDVLAAAEDDPLFSDERPRCRVFQWHGDTFDLPAGATLLATSPRCRHQAFRLGRASWGLQFHVEVDAAMVERWLGEPGNCGEVAALPYIDESAIRQATPAESAALALVSARIFDRFAALCKESLQR